MNKIYKVIWSKVKHQYVVVSELAHSQGKQNSKSERNSLSGSLRTLAAALLIGGSLLAMPYTASAAENDVLNETSVESSIYVDGNGNQIAFIEATKTDTGSYTIDINGEHEYVPFEKLYNVNGQYGVFVKDKNNYDINNVYEEAVTTADGSQQFLPKGQHIVYNEDGFYVSNGKGSYNSLNKDGLWVGSKTGDSTTGFHVDNDGNITTVGTLSVGKNNDNSYNFTVDENGAVKAANGEFTVTADGTTVADGVKLQEGKVTADKADIGDVWIKDGNITHVDKLAANRAAIGGVWIKDNTVTSLSNTKWNEGKEAVANRAATEGQLSEVQGYVDNLEDKTTHIDHKTENGKDYTLVEGTKFENTAAGSKITTDKADIADVWINDDGVAVKKGNVSVENGYVQAGNVVLNGSGERAINVNNEKFVVYDDGALRAADSNFIVQNTGNVKANGTLSVAKQNDDSYAFTVDENGAVKAANGEFTVAADGTTVADGVTLQNGKVTANKAAIGGVYIKEDTVTSLKNTEWNEGKNAVANRAATEGQLSEVQGYVDNLEDKTTHIDHVTEADGTHYTSVEGTKFENTATGSKITADKADIGDVYIKDRNITNVDKLQAVKADIGGVYIKEGKVTAQKADIGGVYIKDNTVTSLENKTWDGKNYVSGRAATEDQLNVVQGYVDNLEDKTTDIDHVTEANGTHYTSIEGAKFYDNGTIANKDNTFEVDAAGKITANKADIGDVWINEKGLTAKNGDVITLDKNGKEKYTLNTIGDDVAGISRENGTTIIENNTKINNSGLTVGSDTEGVTLSTNGTVTASGAMYSEGNKVVTWDNEKNNSINGVQLTTSDGLSKVKADKANIGGVIIKNDEVSGLSNKDWDAENIEGDRAATEGQLFDVDTKVEQNADKLEAYEAAGIVAGTRNNPYTVDGIALGTDSYASGTGATAIGGNAKANQYNSVALGSGAVANAHDSVALGAWSIANDENVVSVGRDDGSIQRRIVNVADGVKNSDAATVGQMNTAIDTAAEGVVKWDSTQNEEGQTIYQEGTIHGVTLNDGKITAANGKFNVYKDGNFEAADGNFSVYKNGSLAIGEADANGKRVFTVNSNSGNVITKGNVTAQGTMYVNGNEEVATKSSVDTVNDTLADYENAGIIAGTSNVDNDVVIGNGSSNTAEYGIAIGEQASNTGFGSMAVGAHTMVSGNNSVALGFGSQATENNVVSVGGYAPGTQRRIINVADGIENSDAATVGQMNTAIDTATEGSVKWDNGTTNTINGVKLQDGDVSVTDENATYTLKTVGADVAGINRDNETTTIETSTQIDKNGLTVGNGKVTLNANAGESEAFLDVNGRFHVNGNGGFVVQNESGDKVFRVFSTGGFEAASGKFAVASDTGNVTTQGTMYVKGDEEVATKSSVDTVNDTLADYENAGIIAGTSNVDNDVVIGNGSSNTAEYGIAIGEQASNTGFGSMAVGAHTMVNGNNSVALGFGSQATENNVVSVGGYAPGTQRRIINVADGVEDSDAATVGQMNTAIDTATEGSVKWDAGTTNTINGVKLQDGDVSVTDNGTEYTLKTVGQNTAGITRTASKSLTRAEGFTTTIEDTLSVDGSENRVAVLGSDGNENFVVKDDIVAVKAENGRDNVFTVNDTGNVYAKGNLNVEGTINNGLKVSSGRFAVVDGEGNEKFIVNNEGTMALKGADGNVNVFTVDQNGDLNVQGTINNGLKVSSSRFAVVDENGTEKFIVNDKGTMALKGVDGTTNVFTVEQNGNVVATGTINAKEMTVNGDVVALAKNVATKDSVAEINTALDSYEKAGVTAGNVAENIEGGIAIGSGFSGETEKTATVQAKNGIAIGGATVGYNAENSVAIGINSSVDAKNSIALGFGSVVKTNQELVVSVGNDSTQRRIINVANGKDDHDVVTVGQMNTLIFGASSNSGSVSISDKLINGASSLIGGINKNTDAINDINAAFEKTEGWSPIEWADKAETIEAVSNQIATFSAVANNIDWDALAKIAPMSLEEVAPVNTEGSANPSTSESGGSANPEDGTANPENKGWTSSGGNTTTTDNVEIGGSLTVKQEAKFDGKATFNDKATFNEDVDMKGELNMNGNKITGVAAGTETTDAVNYGQLRDVQTQVDGLGTRMDSIENRMGDIEERIDKVGAMAAAIANLRTMGYDPEAPTEIAVGVGQYKSETGLALGIFHYPNQDFMLSASISTSGDEVMGGIGATWKLGRKSKSPEEQAKDNEAKMIAKADEIKQAAKDAEVKAQAERHAQLLAEREAEGQPIRPVKEA